MDTTVLGQQGRLVIPAEVRTALGLAPVIASICIWLARGVLLNVSRTLSPSSQQLAVTVPKQRSLVDELLAERRLGAADE